MSDNMKYYYIKIKENFYDTDDIKLLQSMENGYLYSDILMKLFLKSLKFNGKLMFKDHIPFNPKMISTITGHNIAIVEKALGIFKEIGLIEVLDNGAIYMLDIQNFIGKSSTEADRKKEYRRVIAQEKNMLLIEENGQMSGQMSDKRTPEIELEIEIELDKEIDIDIDKKSKESKHKHGEFKHVLLTDDELTKLINEHSSSVIEKAITYLDEYLEMKGTKYKSHYMVLKKWGIEAATKKSSTSNNIKNTKVNKFNDYEQRTYDYDDLEKKLLGWQ